MIYYTILFDKLQVTWYNDIIRKEIANVVLDKWLEFSYYQFPLFENSFERDIYENWYDYIDGDYIYIEEEYDKGDCVCLD